MTELGYVAVYLAAIFLIVAASSTGLPGKRWARSRLEVRCPLCNRQEHGADL